MDAGLVRFVRRHGYYVAVAHFRSVRDSTCAKEREFTAFNAIKFLTGCSKCEKYDDILTQLLYTEDGMRMKKEEDLKSSIKT